MQKVLHIKTTVLPGGKIEIVHKELAEGESVNVVVLPHNGIIETLSRGHLGRKRRDSASSRRQGTWSPI